MSFKRSYAEALEATKRKAAKPRKALKRSRMVTKPRISPSEPFVSAGTQRKASGALSTQGAAKARKRRRLQSKHDPQLAAWSKAVRERDGNRCQWPGGCRTGDTRLDPHHVYSRGRRPDKKYDVDAGITLCRTHHDWVGDHPIEAETMQLLSSETYELARKSVTIRRPRETR